MMPCVQVETFGAMAKTEKIAFILEQASLGFGPDCRSHVQESVWACVQVGEIFVEQISEPGSG